MTRYAYAEAPGFPGYTADDTRPDMILSPGPWSAVRGWCNVLCPDGGRRAVRATGWEGQGRLVYRGRTISGFVATGEAVPEWEWEHDLLFYPTGKNREAFDPILGRMLCPEANPHHMGHMDRYAFPGDLVYPREPERHGWAFGRVITHSHDQDWNLLARGSHILREGSWLMCLVPQSEYNSLMVRYIRATEVAHVYPMSGRDDRSAGGAMRFLFSQDFPEPRQILSMEAYGSLSDPYVDDAMVRWSTGATSPGERSFFPDTP